MLTTRLEVFLCFAQRLLHDPLVRSDGFSCCFEFSGSLGCSEFAGFHLLLFKSQRPAAVLDPGLPTPDFTSPYLCGPIRRSELGVVVGNSSIYCQKAPISSSLYCLYPFYNTARQLALPMGRDSPANCLPSAVICGWPFRLSVHIFPFPRVFPAMLGCTADASPSPVGKHDGTEFSLQLVHPRESASCCFLFGNEPSKLSWFLVVQIFWTQHVSGC